MSASVEVESRRCSCGSFKVLWKIESFCFAVRTNIHKVISPPFVYQDDAERSSWRMRLEMIQSTGEDGEVEFFLERLKSQNSDTEILELNFEVTVNVEQRKSKGHQTTYRFQENSQVCLKLGTVAEMLNMLTPIREDILWIECYIAFPLKERPVSGYSPTYGMVCLSEDLMSLKEKGKLCNMYVEAEDKYMYVHQAILCRSRTFEELLKRCTGKKDPVISLPDFDFNTVSQFLNLIYSGNISYVFDNPSVNMLKCLDYFKLDLLRYYRGVEELNLRTKYKDESHEFHWVIKSFDLKNEGEAIESPLIKRLNVNITWQLTITLKQETISMFANIVDGERPKFYCLEFGIKNSCEDIVFAKRLLGNTQSYDNMGFEDFAAKAQLVPEYLLPEGDLHIVFKARTSDGTANEVVVRRSVAFATPTSEPSYEKLSSDMKKVLEGEKFYDIELKIEGEIVKAHQCVLFARSTAFAEALPKMPRPENGKDPEPFPVPNIKLNVFKIILEYLYSGVLKTSETNLLIQLYVASESLGIASLKKETYDILKFQDIDMDNTDAESVAKAFGGTVFQAVIKDLRSLTLVSPP